MNEGFYTEYPIRSLVPYCRETATKNNNLGCGLPLQPTLVPYCRFAAIKNKNLGCGLGATHVGFFAVESHIIIKKWFSSREELSLSEVFRGGPGGLACTFAAKNRGKKPITRAICHG
jgi:hypothetical protein